MIICPDDFTARLSRNLARSLAKKKWKCYYRNTFKLAVGMREEYHLQNKDE